MNEKNKREILIAMAMDIGNRIFKRKLYKSRKPMPLKKGKSQKVISQNIEEFHTGKTYAHTKAKFGKDRANKQAVAVSMSTAGKSPKRSANKQKNDFSMGRMTNDSNFLRNMK